jgi:hypothetical protein
MSVTPMKETAEVPERDRTYLHPQHTDDVEVNYLFNEK